MDSGLLSANVGDKWSTERIIQFLEEYRNHPCLWDWRNFLYKSKNDRIAAETDILKKMKLQYLDLNVFRSKVRNIRNTYRQEVMKIMKNSKPEAGVDGVFVPKLRWFNLADSFLRKTLELNDIPLAQRCQEEVTSEPDVPVDDSSALEFEDVKPSVDDLRHLDPSWNGCHSIGGGGGRGSNNNNNPGGHKRACPWDASPGQQQATISRCEEKSDSAAAVAFVESLTTDGRASAEFDAFGKYVSLQLQQLPLDVAVELEMEIVNLVCRKRLCLLREKSELAVSGVENPF